MYGVQRHGVSRGSTLPSVQGAGTNVQASAKSAGSPTLVEAHRRTGPNDTARRALE